MDYLVFAFNGIHKQHDGRSAPRHNSGLQLNNKLIEFDCIQYTHVNQTTQLIPHRVCAMWRTYVYIEPNKNKIMAFVLLLVDSINILSRRERERAKKTTENK